MSINIKTVKFSISTYCFYEYNDTLLNTIKISGPYIVGRNWWTVQSYRSFPNCLNKRYLEFLHGTLLVCVYLGICSYMRGQLKNFWDGILRIYMF